MRSVYFILLSLLGCITYVQSQDSARISNAIQGAIKMGEMFSLDKEQVLKIEKINLEFEKEIDSVLNIKMRDAAKGQSKDRIFQKREKYLQTIMTKDQYERYLKFLKDNMLTILPEKGVDPMPGKFLPAEEY